MSTYRKLLDAIPTYTSVVLSRHLGDEKGLCILGRDVRQEKSLIWAYITSDGEFDTYPLDAFNTIDDFKDFCRYGPPSAHGK